MSVCVVSVRCEGVQFYKKNPGDSVWWVDDPETVGVFEFSFDKETVFNLFRDYPDQLTKEQKAVFDRENPFWKEFFSGKASGTGRKQSG